MVTEVRSGELRTLLVHVLQRTGGKCPPRDLIAQAEREGFEGGKAAAEILRMTELGLATWRSDHGRNIELNTDRLAEFVVAPDPGPRGYFLSSLYDQFHRILVLSGLSDVDATHDLQLLRNRANELKR